MQSNQEEDFFVQQLQTSCLSLFTYYIESDKEALVIDPLREPEPYLEILKTRGAKLKYILETHFHADFVSGHVELAKKTGATIVYGPTAKANFELKEAKDGEELPLGKIKMRVLHTPGHTMESSCFLLLTAQGKAHSVYTGDTLFLGDVGRPDLAVKGNEITEKDLAGWLYDSTRNKLMTLEDDVIIYPGHGAGSACGKNIQSGVACTMGKQKQNNYALQKMTRDEFITVLTSGITKPPAYFFHDAGMNRAGYEDLSKVLEKGLKALKIDEFKKLSQEGAVILDTRPVDDAKKSYAKESLCISLAGSYAVWVGALIKPGSKIILITAEGAEKESIIRLARIGYDNILGYLEGGYETWAKSGSETDKWHMIEPEDLKHKLKDKPCVLDIRNRNEWEDGVIEGAKLINMNEINVRFDELPKDQPVYLHCKTGGRSFVTSTLLRKLGINAIDIKGGYQNITVAGIPTKVFSF